MASFNRSQPSKRNSKRCKDRGRTWAQPKRCKVRQPLRRKVKSCERWWRDGLLRLEGRSVLWTPKMGRRCNSKDDIGAIVKVMCVKVGCQPALKAWRCVLWCNLFFKKIARWRTLSHYLSLFPHPPDVQIMALVCLNCIIGFPSFQPNSSPTWSICKFSRPWAKEAALSKCATWPAVPQTFRRYPWSHGPCFRLPFFIERSAPNKSLVWGLEFELMAQKMWFHCVSEVLKSSAPPKSF